MLHEDTTLLFVVNSAVKGKKKSYYKRIIRQFKAVIGIVEEGTDADWISPKFTDIVTYSVEEGKVGALNQAADKVATSFAMLLECDEVCLISNVPAPSSDTCYRALIDVADGKNSQRNYQVRLFPISASEAGLFDGFSVPDISRNFCRMNWELSEDVIPIHKSGPLFEVDDTDVEIAHDQSQLRGLFWQAIIDTENQKFRRAEEKFRKILKNQEQFEFYYLATLNGLANALVEQHKLEEAADVARKSIKANARQRTPYLTLFKVYDLLNDDSQAYESLRKYLGALRFASRANLDVSLPLDECHYLMAHSALKQGNYQQAFEHYEWLYVLNEGDVSLQVLEKLFIFAIELKDYDKSIHYFNDIFGAYIPDNLNGEMSARLLESLSLFMDNEWYDFVSEIYEQLVEHNPEDNELLNGWITTLIRNKEVDRAQEILEKRKAS